jgi:hypothetical protein
VIKRGAISLSYCGIKAAVDALMENDQLPMTELSKGEKIIQNLQLVF